MSKLRESVPAPEGDLSAPPEGDLRAWVVFTQLRPDGPHVYAGWLDAADDDMAVTFACEHYGQDQECVGIWVVPKDSIAGAHVREPSLVAEGPGVYQVFTQAAAGEPAHSAHRVEAENAAAAIEAAGRDIDDADRLHSIWVAPAEQIVSTGEDDVIWRHTDQSYRLARGYAKSVRDKWVRIRKRKALEEYEKDDLKDAF